MDKTSELLMGLRIYGDILLLAAENCDLGDIFGKAFKSEKTKIVNVEKLFLINIYLNI